jgi:hypothetical protein
MLSVLPASGGGGGGVVGERMKKEEEGCMEGRSSGFISELCLQN